MPQPFCIGHCLHDEHSLSCIIQNMNIQPLSTEIQANVYMIHTPLFLPVLSEAACQLYAWL